VKAVVVREFGPVGTARVEDVPAPEPKPGQVQVKVLMAPVNFVDSLVVTGKYQFLPAQPFSPGKGPVGVVSALGAGVERFKIGDRVLAMAEQGGYAQYVCADEEQCYGLPPQMPFAAAVAISLAYDTAWFALTDRARLVPGETVLVLGATGAVGHAAIQLAKAMQARVIAAVSSAARSEAVLAAGADAVVDLSAPGLQDSLREQVWRLTDGRGADVVIDPLGGDVFDAAIRAVAWRGRVVVVGFAAGRIPTIKANYLLVKNIEVSGLQVSDYRKRRPAQMREAFERIFDLYLQTRISPPGVTTYALEDYAGALDDLLGRRAQGRAVLLPWGETSE
jgi:NADPH2:quinone reductase